MSGRSENHRSVFGVLDEHIQHPLDCFGLEVLTPGLVPVPLQGLTQVLPDLESVGPELLLVHSRVKPVRTPIGVQPRTRPRTEPW